MWAQYTILICWIRSIHSKARLAEFRCHFWAFLVFLSRLHIIVVIVNEVVPWLCSFDTLAFYAHLDFSALSINWRLLGCLIFLFVDFIFNDLCWIVWVGRVASIPFRRDILRGIYGEALTRRVGLVSQAGNFEHVADFCSLSVLSRCVARWLPNFVGVGYLCLSLRFWILLGGDVFHVVLRSNNLLLLLERLL